MPHASINKDTPPLCSPWCRQYITGRDDTYGWITDIPAGVTIHKARAVRMYLLKTADLDGVGFNDFFYERSSRYLNEYKERDIEWRAWEIHGGPVGYWDFLKREQARGALRSNILPYSYRNGHRYDLRFGRPELQDRYVCSSPILRNVKAELAPWLWNACNVALDHVLLRGEFPRTPRDLGPHREVAMLRAASFIRSHTHYTERPAQPLGSSRSMTQLRAVLRQAPIAPAPGSPQWGGDVNGLVFDREGEYYDWSPEYLQRVFDVACGVVEELGTGDAGMRTARWGIYDKYSKSPGFGLWYDPIARAWADNTTDWLDDRLSSEELRDHLRGKCPAGIAFNDMLQDNLTRQAARQSPSKLRSSLSPVLPTPGPSQ